jgi:Ser/Thr protein kinase RdoA (MazF antagonist)
VDAVGAAVSVASGLGLSVVHPVLLSDSNNIVVWLQPSPVVAKVATGHHRRLGLELAVAKHLVAGGAAVVGPAPGLPREVHRLHPFEMTFWAYQPQEEVEAEPGQIAGSLFRLHERLMDFPDPLPSYREELDAVERMLADPNQVATLGEENRVQLRSALTRFQSELDALNPIYCPLHGSPHAGNTLVVGDSVRFIDFETACMGPLEWDLAHVDSAVADHYPAAVRADLLRLCRLLVSAKTAAWCWVKYDDQTMRWHADHHLGVVRRAMVDRRVP